MTVPAPNLDQDQAPAELGQLSDQTLDALDDQQAARRSRREAEKERAKAPGGPCVDCGCTLSWLRVGMVGLWHQTPSGPRCVPCHEARQGAAPGSDDREARDKAAREVLGNAPAPPRVAKGDPRPAKDFWHPGNLARFMRWFSEVPGARPSPVAERSAYITAGELLAAMYPEPPPLKLERGPRCPRCRAKDRWLVTERSVYGQAYLSGGGDKVTPGYIEIRRVCWGREGACRYEPEPERRYRPDA